MNCGECGVPFELTNRAKRFCSEKCRRKAEKRRWKAKKLHATQQKRYEETGLMPYERYCKTCGAKFTAKYNGEGYCSESCREIGYKKTKLAGKEAARQRYHENKRPHQIECKWCGSSFESDTKVMYCSDKCRREKLTRSARLNAYGLSQEEYNALEKAQEGRCKICGQEKPLVIDHCHAEGHVRGLLCTQCNSGLGMFYDNVAYLSEAVEYLSR